ncbi:NRDE family protein [Algoriphagus sp. D3-2-R+10]|uniref:NRDE family protein n=1 Tax=Algoriphagus aurantiacus TaxID=3103948 RepID=UPI002B3C2B29|nr:NRDE family protein [Algoriphagus sp. D3-2-R+10]MEB2776097.1 NRDE family protein [Algoriphagus sp. D3-2-R+10]
MCLVAFSWKSHPTYPLIISANRDEFFERPTQVMHLWETGFYAGKDLRSGGTWFGIHPNGRWSLLTNYRDFIHQRESKISRGKLVQDFLESQIDPQDYLKGIEQNKELYDGFNLLVSDGNQLFYYSNFGESVREIQPGIYGLSNGLIDDPWPKSQLAKLQLEQLITQSFDEDNLLEILKSTETADPELLPLTGMAPELESALSSQLIRINENYGTVSSTAVLQHKSGFTKLKERTFEWDYHRFEDREFQFQLEKPI